MGTATPTLDTVVSAMVTVLKGFLPAPVPALPSHNVAVSSLQEKSAGIGRRVGTDAVAGFGVIDMKAVRLDVVAQFQLWDTAADKVEDAMNALNTRILAKRDNLWSLGFLRLAMEKASPAENIPATGWRKVADYRVLYERPYQDTDDADSLIARIPIGIDSEFNESIVVTDAMARWDNEAAPKLVVRGRFSVSTISTLVFISGAAPSGSVTVTRTFDGAVGAPTPHASMAHFLAAVKGANPAERHASVSFVGLTDFLNAFDPGASSVNMGDWDLDGIPDPYTPQSLGIEPPIQLKSAEDRLEIQYADPALNHTAVLYLRLARSAAR
jgi:hypothetical protein